MQFEINLLIFFTDLNSDRCFCEISKFLQNQSELPIVYFFSVL